MIIVERVEPVIKIKPVDSVPRVKDKKQDEKNGENAFEKMLNKEKNKQEKPKRELKQTNKTTNIDTYEPSMTLDEIINANTIKSNNDIYNANRVLNYKGNVNTRLGTYTRDGIMNFGI